MSELTDVEDDVKASRGPIMCLLHGGSTLYGLDNAESDLDLRGIYTLSDPSRILGLPTYGKRTFENYQSQTEEIDVALYDIRKFLYLLSKTNTQVVEILYADESDFISVNQDFRELIANRNKLIDTGKMYNSLRGYIHNERRLMNGERTGQLGGKRKAALEKYGYSYKNLVQILRLSWCGAVLFEKGYYPVKVAREDQDFHDTLMCIKENPGSLTLAQAEKLVDNADLQLQQVHESKKYDWTFDFDYANDFITRVYGKIITEHNV